MATILWTWQSGTFPCETRLSKALDGRGTRITDPKPGYRTPPPSTMQYRLSVVTSRLQNAKGVLSRWACVAKTHPTKNATEAHAAPAVADDTLPYVAIPLCARERDKKWSNARGLATQSPRQWKHQRCAPEDTNASPDRGVQLEFPERPRRGDQRPHQSEHYSVWGRAANIRKWRAQTGRPAGMQSQTQRYLISSLKLASLLDIRRLGNHRPWPQ